MKRKKIRLSPPVLITEASQLTPLISRLSQARTIAVDTESNSLHAYREQVCLIQFSTPGADYLIDPLADVDLAPLGAVFADPAIEKVFHAAEYDVMCLRRDFGWTFANLFDTMWAARVLGWPHNGLGNILQEQFDVRLDKRWQRHDWGHRPLSPEALAYARLDTHYLLPLRDRMAAELTEKGRLDEAREFFDEVAQAQPNFRTFDPDADLWRVKGVWDLEPREQAVLRELVIWRDGEAQRQDRPLFKILTDQALVALAQARPQRFEEITGIDGFKDYHRRRYGRKIVRAIAKGLEAELPPPPSRPLRPPDAVLQRYEALRRWRKRIAAQRDVEPDVVISNAMLWTLAQRAPKSLRELDALDVLGSWKLRTYGKALLSVLSKI
jgi:ribonuclease D